MLPTGRPAQCSLLGSVGESECPLEADVGSPWRRRCSDGTVRFWPRFSIAGDAMVQDAGLRTGRLRNINGRTLFEGQPASVLRVLHAWPPILVFSLQHDQVSLRRSGMRSLSILLTAAESFTSLLPLLSCVPSACRLPKVYICLSLSGTSSLTSASAAA